MKKKILMSSMIVVFVSMFALCGLLLAKSNSVADAGNKIEFYLFVENPNNPIRDEVLIIDVPTMSAKQTPEEEQGDNSENTVVHNPGLVSVILIFLLASTVIGALIIYRKLKEKSIMSQHFK